MSWFKYGKHTNKHIGCWLRYYSNPDIVKAVKKSGLKHFYETVQVIRVIKYIKPVNSVILEVTCKNIIDAILGKERYIVFTISLPVNEEWIVEGDLGEGINFFK